MHLKLPKMLKDTHNQTALNNASRCDFSPTLQGSVQCWSVVVKSTDCALRLSRFESQPHYLEDEGKHLNLSVTLYPQ